MSKVLVTGGSGFLGSWCIVRLLAAGHDVATTVRDLKRALDVRSMVSAAGGDGAREEDLIAAACEGSLRVLRAARDTGVRRVVLTSSFAAVGYGHADRSEPYTETDWTDITQPDVAPYIKSKTLAERAAWDFMASDGGAMELAVINPVGIFGPVSGPDYSSSIDIVRRFLDGSVPAVPRTYFGLVDVRDVAELHLSAMTSPSAAGERFIAVAGGLMSMLDVATVLRRELGPAAAKVPSRELPDVAVRALGLTSPQMRQIVPQLGKRRPSSNSKARSVLDWRPRPNEEVIVATARSLIERGLVSIGR
jgi:dihydroflavonol-4-reductase